MYRSALLHLTLSSSMFRNTGDSPLSAIDASIPSPSSSVDSFTFSTLRKNSPVNRTAPLSDTIRENLVACSAHGSSVAVSITPPHKRQHESSIPEEEVEERDACCSFSPVLNTVGIVAGKFSYRTKTGFWHLNILLTPSTQDPVI